MKGKLIALLAMLILGSGLGAAFAVGIVNPPILWNSNHREHRHC